MTRAGVNKGAETAALKPFIDQDRSSCICCPKCGGPTRVIDSRAGAENSVRRRRACTTSSCLHRITTFEVAIEHAPLLDLVQLSVRLKGRMESVRELLGQVENIIDAAVYVTKIDQR